MGHIFLSFSPCLINQYESCKLIYNEFVYIYHGSQKEPWNKNGTNLSWLLSLWKWCNLLITWSTMFWPKYLTLRRIWEWDVMGIARVTRSPQAHGKTYCTSWRRFRYTQYEIQGDFMSDLGWLWFGCSSHPAQLLWPICLSHQHRQKWADSGTAKIKVNPTQVWYLLNHPVKETRPIHSEIFWRQPD